MSIRENLLVTAGTRAAYMDASGIIVLPTGAEGEDRLAEFTIKTVDRYINEQIDEPFDLYIESALRDEYGTYKCPRCRGTGVVPLGPGIRGVKLYPVCSMKEWAEKEVALACKKEGGCDYGIGCYKSALKAFNSLLDDGHSGFSIIATKNILNRLIDGLPITHIEDVDDVWEYRGYRNKGGKAYNSYQCIRKSSLFKDVYDDGTVKYTDVDRVSCIDINNPTVSGHNGFIRNIIDELVPITFPYMPSSQPIKVYKADYLTDPKNGDYDTMCILNAYLPDGTFLEINRYFKEGADSWEEITCDEYLERKLLHLKREEAENLKED